MRTTLTQARADLFAVIEGVDQDDVTVSDTAPVPNQRPAGPSLYISPDARESADHNDWLLTLELSIQIDQPGYGESQQAIARIIDAVEAAFDANNPGYETAWQATTRNDLGIFVCSWNVTIPREIE